MNFDPIVVAMVFLIEMLNNANEEKIDPDFSAKFRKLWHSTWMNFPVMMCVNSGRSCCVLRVNVLPRIR